MSTLALAAFLHVVSAVFVTGYALFWVVIAAALGREESADAGRLLGVTADARWPPAGPSAMRLRLPLVGWAILAALALTGIAMATLYGAAPTALLTGGTPWGQSMTLKMVAFVVLLAGQTALTIRPRAWLAYVNGGLTLAILLLSAFLRH